MHLTVSCFEAFLLAEGDFHVFIDAAQLAAVVLLLCCCCVRVSSCLVCAPRGRTVVHPAYTGMRLHTATSTAGALCCLVLRLEAFVTLHEMARNARPRSVEFRRSSIHLPKQPPQQQQQQQQQRQQQRQQQQQQRGGGIGARYSLSYCRSAGTSRTLLPRVPPAGYTVRHKRTALQQQQQQQQQFSSPFETGRSDAVQKQQQLHHPNPSRTRRSKHARSESNSVRWGVALSAESGGGGEESNALLLRMDFDDADVEGLRTWIRRYPFGVALPVQPFSLVETEMGVDVIFRKKPTLERGSQDGGLSFTVIDSEVKEGVDLPSGPALIMRRNSEGQEIRKMFAERIVVKAIVKSLAGDGSPPPPAGTKVRAVLHEGLV